MIILGLRCTTSDFYYSVIDGTLTSYSVVASERIKYPTGYNQCEQLKWFHNEIGGLITKHKIYGIGIKGTEPMAMKGKAYGDRVELEAMVFLKAAEAGIKYAIRKVNSTIAKDLGLKGKAKYLADGFDYSAIPNFAKLPKNFQEATQVGLSMLKNLNKMGAFQFIKRLGSGFFGEVWYVNDTGLDAKFALKLIPPDKVINSSNFYQEAQTLKAAEHQNIVHVFEAGEMDDGNIYVKMEYLKNGSLEDEASGVHVALTRAKKLMVDILRGLEHAHSKGIIHRDIKPANILIGDAREGKLSDFGLALPDLSKIDTSTLKKYQYWMHLAPEVNKLDDYTYLSDIYSCGMTLYRLVNGDIYAPTLPATELRKKIKAGKFPDRTAYREFIPISLKRVINKALSVSPGDRYQSADDMRHALEQVPVFANWTEHLLPNGIEWKYSHNHTMVNVKRFKNKKGTWDVEVKKGKSSSELRKVNRLCVEGGNLKQAIQHTKAVLQDFVTRKER